MTIIAGSDLKSYNALKAHGYKTAWVGDGKICLEPPTTTNVTDALALWDRWMRAICPADGTPRKLGNVEFWIDTNGPWAGQVAFSIEKSQWDRESVNRDLSAALIAAGPDPALVVKAITAVNTRLKAAHLLLDIQENETIMKGRKTFRGNAQLQRIIEYLVNTD